MINPSSVDKLSSEGMPLIGGRCITSKNRMLPVGLQSPMKIRSKSSFLSSGLSLPERHRSRLTHFAKLDGWVGLYTRALISGSTNNPMRTPNGLRS